MRRVASFLLMLGLAGCSTTTPPASQDDAAAPIPTEASPAAPEPRPAPVRYGNFESATLEALLRAELELRRGALSPALEQYGIEARRTRDPGVIRQAARLAELARDDEAAFALARLWVDVAPEDPRARRALVQALIGLGRFDAAIEELAGASSSGTELGYLATLARPLDAPERAELARALAALPTVPGGESQLAAARAALLEEFAPDEALAILDEAAALSAGVEAILLRGRLLEATGDVSGSVALLQLALEQLPDARRLRFTLARQLIEVADLEGARVQFSVLLAEGGASPEILLSLALITLELGRLDEAVEHLQEMLRAGMRPDTAHYFLGLAEERRGRRAAALDAFARVRPGFEFSRTQAAAAGIAFYDAGAEGLARWLDAARAAHPEESVMLWLLEAQLLVEGDEAPVAIARLGDAIANRPDVGALHYARAMAHDSVGDLAGLEADLRRVLELQPDDARALNALGYTLADRTERLSEARELVERALTLSPDEPAYVDSLGWVEFRSGNLARAVELLEQAFADFPNHEVAAHYGEALWALGERARAFEVWRRGLALPQETPVLEDTLDRLLDETDRAELEQEPS